MSLLVPRGLVNGTEFLEDRGRSSWRRSFLSHIPARIGGYRGLPGAPLSAPLPFPTATPP